jgi:hypothetical protein
MIKHGHIRCRDSGGARRPASDVVELETVYFAHTLDETGEVTWADDIACIRLAAAIIEARIMVLPLVLAAAGFSIDTADAPQREGMVFGIIPATSLAAEIPRGRLVMRVVYWQNSISTRSLRAWTALTSPSATPAPCWT